MREDMAPDREDRGLTASDSPVSNPLPREEILRRRTHLPTVDADAVRRDLDAVIAAWGKGS